MEVADVMQSPDINVVEQLMDADRFVDGDPAQACPKEAPKPAHGRHDLLRAQKPSQGASTEKLDGGKQRREIVLSVEIDQIGQPHQAGVPQLNLAKCCAQACAHQSRDDPECPAENGFGAETYRQVTGHFRERSYGFGPGCKAEPRVAVSR